MATAERRLEQRAQQLEQAGADALRIEALARAGRFKRSWIEMAETLLEVRQKGSFEHWGYKDLYAYCSDELLLRRKTVDKLVGSYAALKRHAPEKLTAEQTLPSFDSVDYYTRAVEEPTGEPGPAQGEVADELKKAVFDDLEPVTTLRKRFNPVLYSKSDEEEERARFERANNGSRRLRESIARLDGLSSRRVATVTAALEGLERDLERLIAGVARAS